MLRKRLSCWPRSESTWLFGVLRKHLECWACSESTCLFGVAQRVPLVVVVEPLYAKVRRTRVAARVAHVRVAVLPVGVPVPPPPFGVLSQWPNKSPCQRGGLPVGPVFWGTKPQRNPHFQGQRAGVGARGRAVSPDVQGRRCRALKADGQASLFLPSVTPPPCGYRLSGASRCLHVRMSKENDTLTKLHGTPPWGSFAHSANTR